MNREAHRTTHLMALPLILLSALLCVLTPLQASAQVSWTRLGGDTAYDTMELVVKNSYPSTAKTVIVATGDGYWDALSAAGLAGCYDAPVVTTPTGSLKAQAKRTIQRLNPDRIYVMGGKAAISDSTYKAIQAAAPKAQLTRVAGSNAPATARDAYAKGSGWSDTCIVATVNGYWDALSISSYSFASKAPIFLTEGNNKLSKETVSTIKSHFKNTVIVGGTAVVSKDVESQLSGQKVTRLAGANAIATSAKIAEWGIKSGGMSAKHVTVATSDGYWDALAGASLAGRSKSVIALVSDGNRNAASTAWKHRGSSFESGYILGGKAAVSAKTESYLKGLDGSGSSSTTQPSQPSESYSGTSEPKPTAGGTTYVLNTGTRKFHKLGCREVKKISASNKVQNTYKRQDIIACGYSACKVCNP